MVLDYFSSFLNNAWFYFILIVNKLVLVPLSCPNGGHGMEVGGRNFGLRYALGPHTVFIIQKLTLNSHSIYRFLNTFHPEPLKSDSLHYIRTLSYLILSTLSAFLVQYLRRCGFIFRE